MGGGVRGEGMEKGGRGTSGWGFRRIPLLSLVGESVVRLGERLLQDRGQQRGEQLRC